MNGPTLFSGPTFFPHTLFPDFCQKRIDVGCVVVTTRFADTEKKSAVATDDIKPRSCAKKLPCEIFTFMCLALELIRRYIPSLK